MPVFLCLAASDAYLSAHVTALESFIADYGAAAFDWTSTTGCAIFHQGDALKCTLALHAHLIADGLPVGMALHVGSYERLGHLLLGAGPLRSRYVAQAAWGGQILLTQEYVSMVGLPPEASAKALGVCMLADLAQPAPLYQLQHPVLRTDGFSPLRSLSYYPHNLRVQTTTFVGRSRELQELMARVRTPDTRLITLTGSGGVGKTRLALQIAAETIRDFPQGAFFIPCEAISVAGLLPSIIAQALRIPFSERLDSRTQLLNQLRRRSLLLLLDNYESLLPDTDLLAEILAQAPRLKLLVTSRESLGLPQEQLYTLEGLSFPRRSRPEDVANYERFDAVQLFFLAAVRADPLFAVAESARNAIISICEMTEGLPLALELAATLVRSFSCEEVARTLEHGLDYLATTRRDLPPRHRSLHAVFEYTWEKLSAAEREAFARCAVFHGAFSEAAAQDVIAATPAVLQSLVQKSMLVQPTAQRYKLHPLLLHYAKEKLGANPEQRATFEAQHGLYYLAFLWQQQPLLWSAQQRAILERLAEDMDNICVAWLWACREGRFANIHGIFLGLFNYYLLRGLFQDGAMLFAESATLLRAALAANPSTESVDQQALMACLMAQGILLAHRAQNDQAEVLLAEALEFYVQHQVRHEQGSAHLGLGLVAFNRGQFALALAHLQRLYELSLETDCRLCQRDALHYLGQTSYFLGDYPRAGVYLDQSLALSEAIGDWWLKMHTIRLRGNVEKVLGRSEIAREYYLRSLELAREVDSLQAISLALNNLAVLAVIASEYQMARRYWEQALTLQRDAGNPRALANTLHNLAVVVTDLGEPELGLQLLQEALALHRNGADQNGEGYVLLYRAYAFEVLEQDAAAESTYREALTFFEASGHQAGAADVLECLAAFLVMQARAAEAEVLLQRARQLRLAQGGPGGLAAALRGLGSVAVACGRYDEARMYLREALELASSAQWIGALLYTFVEVAELRAQTGDVVGALAILLPVLQDQRTVYPVQRRVRRRVAELLALLPPEFVAAMQRYEGSLDVLALAETLVQAL